MTRSPAPIFDHLLHLTNQTGTFEHARLDQPLPEHGYCTDDMARVLIVATRQPEAGGDLHRIAGVAIRFLDGAQSFSGGCRNRMDQYGNWQDQPTVEDCWGRSLWGLGTAAAHSDVGLVRRLAVIQFERSAQVRSPSPRAMAFAALGAAELLTAQPQHQQARALLANFADGLAGAGAHSAWPWPEPRLAYANAALPEAMIAAGAALGRTDLCRRGLDLLAWLLDHESGDGHLSPTPVGGRGPGDVGPAFDQQPIEVAALADACARAATVDSSAIWPDGMRAAAAWFEGDNDAGQPMWDPLTGAGFDGLHADGVNLNQGAESTLAALSTFQHAQRLATVPQ